MTTPPDHQPFQRFLDRAAPRLRRLDEVITGNETLNAARDAVVERVVEVSRNAVDSIRGLGDDANVVEGSVVDTDTDTDGPATTRTAAAPAATMADGAAYASTGPHWNAARVRRVAVAATREAFRPAGVTPQRARVLRTVGVVAATAIVTAAVTWRIATHADGR